MKYETKIVCRLRLVIHKNKIPTKCIRIKIKWSFKNIGFMMTPDHIKKYFEYR